MELKWIEDFLKLAETGSFSRAADARYVTQPAFSRRIRALEAWLGVELIDRSAYPMRLTRAGEQFRGQAADMLERMLEARAVARGLQSPAEGMLNVAATHTIALTFYPHWLADMKARGGHIKSKMIAANVHDAVTMLVEGHADVLLCYHHPHAPVELDASRYDMIVLGKELLAPYAKANMDGTPQFTLPATKDAPVPYLAYTPSAYLGRMVDIILQEAPQRAWLECVYETDMAEALKVMVREGLGIAWLPESSVRREVRSKQIVRCGDGPWLGQVEIRVYRDRTNTKPTTQKLWELVAK
jgi:LysR family transcriptional regulator, hypochlorite-specific transcription factor HypT